MESAKEYFKDEPNDFHSVIYESRDVNYPHAYGPGCGVSEKTKKWMDKVKRYIYIVHLNRDIFITLEVWDMIHTHLTHQLLLITFVYQCQCQYIKLHVIDFANFSAFFTCGLPFYICGFRLR